MALVKPVIFQIVGYQDSGKTITMIEVVKLLSSDGFKIATIKHHGHGGKPDLAEKKDSGRHVEAGALASLIEGEGRVLIQAEKSEWSLLEEIKLLSTLSPNLILIEGHKFADFPKAVLLRDEQDLPLLEELSNIQGVFCRKPEVMNKLVNHRSYPAFFKTDEFYSWIIGDLKQRLSADR
jgi:molybdopterin-guanine dinucleotide biosynthesis adapter protein